MIFVNIIEPKRYIQVVGDVTYWFFEDDLIQGIGPWILVS